MSVLSVVGVIVAVMIVIHALNALISYLTIEVIGGYIADTIIRWRRIRLRVDMVLLTYAIAPRKSDAFIAVRIDELDVTHVTNTLLRFSPMLKTRTWLQHVTTTSRVPRVDDDAFTDDTKVTFVLHAHARIGFSQHTTVLRREMSLKQFIEDNPLIDVEMIGESADNDDRRVD